MRTAVNMLMATVRKAVCMRPGRSRAVLIGSDLSFSARL
jgi:hypothetical protein